MKEIKNLNKFLIKIYKYLYIINNKYNRIYN